MYIIAGLGNPGPRYHMTRHNVGFDTIDYLAAQYRLTKFKTKHKALVSEGMMQGRKVMLVKPQTFMNNSGEALAEILAYYKVEPSQLIVIYDDIDLEPGKLRIRPKGGPGTHNGMRSIVSQLNTEDFPRVRIGIGKPEPQIDLVDFVLGRFSPEERTLVNEAIERAALAVATMVCASVEVAMAKYNG